MRVVLAALALVVVVTLGSVFGWFRTSIAVAMFAVIAVLGIRYLSFMLAPPPEPEITEVAGYGLKYVCTMCGLELRVEKVAKDRPPTHCMEPMELVRDDGRPPLRPV